MKKSKFSETQIVAILKQAEAGMAVSELAPATRLQSGQRLRMARGSLG